MDDGYTVIHKYESWLIQCNCRTTPCVHINYLYSLLEKIPRGSLENLLSVKSIGGIPPLTDRQYDDMRGAVARAYNTANNVLGNPPIKPLPLGWQGKVPGIDDVFRVEERVNSKLFQVSMQNILIDEIEFPIVAEIIKDDRRNTYVCNGCEGLEATSACVHIRAFDEARITWTENGMLANRNIPPLYRTLDGRVTTGLEKGSRISTDPLDLLQRIEDTIVTEYFRSVDPASKFTFDETAFRVIARYGWDMVNRTSPVITSTGAELPVDGNVVKSRRPIEPEPEEPKEPPKPPTRFGDLEI